MQLAHRQGAHQQIDVRRPDRLAAGGDIVRRRGDEGHLGGVLAGRRLRQVLDQPHAQRPIGADRLEPRQGLGIAIDRLLQLGPRVANGVSLDEDGRDAGIDQRRLEGAHPRHHQLVHQVAGGEHGPPALAIALVRRIEEFELDLGGGEGDAIELKVPGLLHRAIGHRHLGDDGLADIGLPDAHRRQAIRGDAFGGHQPVGEGKGAHGGGEVTAVTAPVDEGLVDGHLAKEVVDVVIGPAALGQDHRLAGAGGRPAHAIDLLAIGVRAADDAQQQLIPGWPGHLGGGRQVLEAEEDALAGAAAQIGSGDFDLG